MSLSANSVLDLPTGTHFLAFSNSSSIPWSNGVSLTITNWNGLTNGGGPDQLLFGNSNAGLTQTQVSQLQFANPVGLLPGLYPARLLGTGEIVPDTRPLLMSSKFGNDLVL